VGDVLGHGLQAAVSMTKLRLAMQSAAMIDANPTLMLRVADATLHLSDPDAYATAIAAIYDSVTRTLTFACAGHPGPALRTADGAVEIVNGSGSMLGLRTGDEAQTQTIAIDAGSTLVFYTDGLIEMTRDIDEGYRRLSAALQRDDLLQAARPAHALVETVLGRDNAHDDIAVLVVRFD
jgi:serine phosphatase RsbU (regulator of sigma subunit)